MYYMSNLNYVVSQAFDLVISKISLSNGGNTVAIFRTFNKHNN